MNLPVFAGAGIRAFAAESRGERIVPVVAVEVNRVFAAHVVRYVRIKPYRIFCGHSAAQLIHLKSMVRTRYNAVDFVRQLFKFTYELFAPVRYRVRLLSGRPHLGVRMIFLEQARKIAAAAYKFIRVIVAGVASGREHHIYPRRAFKNAPAPSLGVLKALAVVRVPERHIEVVFVRDF